MARRGRELEKLVKQLETLLSSYTGTTIESPSYLKDKITGEKREFDVLITMTVDHHKLLTAFECKDWKKKVDAPIVEGFSQKLKDTGV